MCEILGFSIEFILDDKCKHGKKINEEKLCNSNKPSQSNFWLKHLSNMQNTPSIEQHEEKWYQDSYNDFMKSIAKHCKQCSEYFYSFRF